VEAPSFVFAFGAGVLSILSPCVLPLVPAYLAFLTGMSPDEMSVRRSQVMSHAVAFLFGFSLVFLALGAVAEVIAVALIDYGHIVRWVGGGLIVLLGLSILGLLPIALLKREARLKIARKPAGYVGSAVVGFGFAAGWTPCIGPILAGVLLVAAQQPGLGVPLLATYTAGFAVPFLAFAYFVGTSRALRRGAPVFERIGGAVMVLVGVLLATDAISVISRYLVDLVGFQGF
jgi:cytochrome c-type biogenesis protein